jgi:hypothetical protein
MTALSKKVECYKCNGKGHILRQGFYSRLNGEFYYGYYNGKTFYVHEHFPRYWPEYSGEEVVQWKEKCSYCDEKGYYMQEHSCDPKYTHIKYPYQYYKCTLCGKISYIDIR